MEATACFPSPLLAVLPVVALQCHVVDVLGSVEEYAQWYVIKT